MGIKLSLIKPLITIMQMVQFVIIMVHSLFHLYFDNKYWPAVNVLIEFWLMVQVCPMLSLTPARGVRSSHHP